MNPTGANPGYALGQLARALHAGRTLDDPAARGRAEAKAAAWVRVFEGMLAGTLDVGSRTPVAGVPAWATLEVAAGGFATGDLPAGGDLRPHERALLTALPPATAAAGRAALNAYYLSDAGLADLRRMLASGCYRVGVPEETALLVVAWLLDRDDPDAARAVLDEIGPFLPRLRFYPAPDPTPPADGPVVHLRTVGEAAADLAAVRDRPEVVALSEAVRVWLPLYDRVVALFAETVAGPLPVLRGGAVEGGWPCQHYPDGWRGRAAAALNDYRRLRAAHPVCGKPDDPRRHFARLRTRLEVCAADPRRLTGRDVGVVRLALAGYVAKHGPPGSPRLREQRQRQAAQVAAPSRAEVARALAGRLAELPQNGGLDDTDAVCGPVNGRAVPRALADKVRRCLAAPVPELVEAGVIPSAEVLARVVPQVTAQVRAAGIADADLRRLYGAVYAAFRRRRSLLLLNLASQVRLEELPWVRAVEPYRRAGLGEREQARQALEQLVTLAVTAFPHQILPNKLLQEVRSLADAAGLAVPLVDEVAADIFMGTFTDKYLRAAQTAAGLLAGGLYERYYGLPYDRVRGMGARRSWFGPATSQEFDRLCAELAGPGEGAGSWVARNGTIIEQEQILTTHNLAVLFESLGLTGSLRPRLPELARRCFAWACRRLRHNGHGSWPARLRAVKNAAYAWRQMTFFLALLPGDAVGEFLAWADDHLAQQPTAFLDRFRPALAGLRSAAAGGPAEGNGGRRFLGWATGRHWLLA